MIARRSSDRLPVKLDLTVLLGPTRPDPLWGAEKAGWRCFVMGIHQPSYRRGSRLRIAWQRGFDAAARSPDPERLML
ncbi:MULTISPECIES: hypothetical protein [unclassified Sphingomonas]|uniref:hypothetical protein n=1 Tax=unclassified Sphingomonas TaxID=196159 RepID=UPI00226AAD9B|nr:MULTISPECIES: hypothetical protein [unclassified Sphingomonas]